MAALDRVVGPDEEATRIDVLLAAWLDQPRGRVQGLIDAGFVEVDGVVVAKSRRVVAGARVVVATDDAVAAQRPAPPPIPVRYSDEHLAVVAKPAGLVVHPGAGTDGAGTRRCRSTRPSPPPPTARTGT